MADHSQVLKRVIEEHAGKPVTFPVLVPNLKGLGKVNRKINWKLSSARSFIKYYFRFNSFNKRQFCIWFIEKELKHRCTKLESLGKGPWDFLANSLEEILTIDKKKKDSEVVLISLINNNHRIFKSFLWGTWAAPLLPPLCIYVLKFVGMK